MSSEASIEGADSRDGADPSGADPSIAVAAARSPEARSELLRSIREHNQQRQKLMLEALSLSGVEDGYRFISKGIPQSQLFMLELIPVLHELYISEPEGARKAILDVGPQNFAGTALLRDLHRDNSFNRLKLDVTALDIVDEFDLFREIIAPGLEFLHQDIFDINNRAWDTVICSHVIEHVPEPLEFLKQLQTLARDYVMVACPWNENPLVTNSHINTIDKSFIVESGARNLKIYTNYCWGKTCEVCMF